MATPRELQKAATAAENERILERYLDLYKTKGLRGQVAANKVAVENDISVDTVWYKIKVARKARLKKEKDKNAA